ncbi:MAG: M28 family peptidase [Saccharofermentanales bacterium]
MIYRNFRIPSLILCFIIFSMIFSGCNDSVQVSPTVNVGMEGVDFAKSLASLYPYRKAYSDQEKNAASLIYNELKDMGYDPETVSFGKGSKVSQNIIVKISGNGFLIPETSESDSPEITLRKQVIAGAHYDTAIGIEKRDDYPDYDGIQGNASGVGALISVAKELKKVQMGYDIVLVFFGAGSDNFAGSNAYFENMSEKEISDTDVMYCIDSIYAGDKLYAHSGVNSIQKKTKYERRRKLYELSDVAILNRIDLRFNVSDLDVDVDGDKKKDVYREISLTKSDYSVFDKADISCVFIESYEYFGATTAEQVESKNPFFGDTNGRIRGTKYDSLKLITGVFEEDRLETRIKDTAFILVEGIKRGIYIAGQETGN